MRLKGGLNRILLKNTWREGESRTVQVTEISCLVAVFPQILMSVRIYPEAQAWYLLASSLKGCLERGR